MKVLFDFADKFNRPRNELSLPIHWVPQFVLTISSFLKWILKVYIYVSFVLLPFGFLLSGVTSSSMTPTCQTNEILLSSQLGYGIKLSKILPIQIQTEKETFLDKVWWRYDTPKLGDIVAFKVPSDQESTYTKRIVGDEGDIVQFKNGVLFINKVPVKLTFLYQYTFLENNKYISGSLYEEVFPNGNKHNVLYLEPLGKGFLDNTEEFVVPKGHVFCVGDNRHDSDDSRSALSFVEKRHIMGKAVMILFSNGNLTNLNAKKFIKGINLQRCLTWMI